MVNFDRINNKFPYVENTVLFNNPVTRESKYAALNVDGVCAFVFEEDKEQFENEYEVIEPTKLHPYTYYKKKINNDKK